MSTEAGVQPVVLVGGHSRRFGRDKLRETVRGTALVEHPIEALRAVFGPRVMLVGACDAQVRALADGEITDLHPGAGPIGGIISALAHCGGPVFVLAGDMPAFGPDEVRQVLRASEGAPNRLAAWAWNDRPHPCAGWYAAGALPLLSAALAAGHHRLHDALPEERVVRVPIDVSRTANINRPDDLPGCSSAA